MRLIDADALFKNVLKWMPPDPCGREEREFPFATDICASMLMEIKEAPTIEPEIIRCKDCKHWIRINRTNRYWCKTDDGLYDLNPSPDDFCSRAERRTDEPDR